MEDLLKERKEKLKKIYEGGGQKALAKQKEKGNRRRSQTTPRKIRIGNYSSRASEGAQQSGTSHLASGERST